MKKAEVSIVLLTQIFRLVIAAIVIIGVVNFCTTKLTNISDENFKSADKLMKELSDPNTEWSSELFMFSTGEFGVFFRDDYQDVKMFTSGCWPKIAVSHAETKSNPESDCFLSNALIPIKIEKPSQCVGDCFCVIRAETDSGGIKFKKMDSLDKFTVANFVGANGDKTPFDEYYFVSPESVSCRTIDIKPIKENYFSLEKTVYVTKYTSHAQAHSSYLLPENKKENIYTEGGVILVPPQGETLTYYFKKNNQNEFFVCKHEESCRP